MDNIGKMPAFQRGKTNRHILGTCDGGEVRDLRLRNRKCKFGNGSIMVQLCCCLVCVKSAKLPKVCFKTPSSCTSSENMCNLDVANGAQKMPPCLPSVWITSAFIIGLL